MEQNLCCLLNPIMGGNGLPCYCSDCHRLICEPCTENNFFTCGDTSWYHHKACKAKCNRDNEWHEASITAGCKDHKWCPMPGYE